MCHRHLKNTFEAKAGQLQIAVTNLLPSFETLLFFSGPPAIIDLSGFKIVVIFHKILLLF